MQRWWDSGCWADVWVCDENCWQRTFTDVHCHCLPALDDGPADAMEALSLCQALVADRVDTVLATPHQLGRFDGLYDGQQIRLAVRRLNQVLLDAGLPLTVLPGAVVRLDERIGELLYMDQILTVADGGRYLLLDLPPDAFVDPRLLFIQLGKMGVQVVLSHPERHAFLAHNPGYLRRWFDHRPCLQITAGSLLGDFGPLARRAAWTFLNERLPVLVASEAHDTGWRAPMMTVAYTWLAHRMGRFAADVLCVDNPRRLVEGEDLLVLGRAVVQREVCR